MPEQTGQPAAQKGDAEVRVALTPDQMRATLVFPGVSDPESAIIPDALAIRAAAEARGIHIDPAVEAAIDAAAAHIAEHPTEKHEAVLAEGVNPVHGKDGRFELVEHLAEARRLAQQKKKKYAEIGQSEEERRRLAEAAAAGEGEVVDHYERSSLMVVREGETIGTIVPPTDGQDGRDVSGAARPAVRGVAFDIEHDASIDIAPGGQVVTKKAGLLVIHGRQFQVQTSLQINGAVDFSTGNIDFPGSVRVSAGIQDRFAVSADTDIEVLDIVEAATLEAGRDIFLQGGMSARGKGTIKAGRDVKAIALEHMSGTVGRDLKVEREIKASDLRVGGAVTGSQARITAGTLIAGGAVTVQAIGANAGTATEVASGRFPDLEKGATRALAALEAIDAATAKHADVIARLEATPKLNPEEAERLTLLILERSTREKSRENASRAIQTVADLLKKHADPRISVTGKVSPGVTLTLGPWILTFNKVVQGPLELSLDQRGKPVVERDRTVDNASTIAVVEPDETYPDLAEWQQSDLPMSDAGVPAEAA